MCDYLRSRPTSRQVVVIHSDDDSYEEEEDESCLTLSQYDYDITYDLYNVNGRRLKHLLDIVTGNACILWKIKIHEGREGVSTIEISVDKEELHVMCRVNSMDTMKVLVESFADSAFYK